MNSYGEALTAYYAGDSLASFTLRRNDGFEVVVPAEIFFVGHNFSSLETYALELCKGSILDIGAGAGRHSLKLIEKGHAVTALDMLPCLGEIMRVRGIENVVVSDIFSFSGARFDTLLMLMNGIGMVGSNEKLVEFLLKARDLTNDLGQIICDSIDVGVTACLLYTSPSPRDS